MELINLFLDEELMYTWRRVSLVIAKVPKPQYCMCMIDMTLGTHSPSNKPMTYHTPNIAGHALRFLQDGDISHLSFEGPFIRVYSGYLCATLA